MAKGPATANGNTDSYITSYTIIVDVKWRNRLEVGTDEPKLEVIS